MKCPHCDKELKKRIREEKGYNKKIIGVRFMIYCECEKFDYQHFIYIENLMEEALR